MNVVKNITETEKQIVLEQLKSIPPQYVFVVGNEGNGFSPQDLILKIQQNDPIGLEYIEIQMNYLRNIQQRTAPNT